MKCARSLLFLLLLFSPALAPLVHAGTFTAASCNYSDVNAMINGPTHAAANGDTIVIPAGTCTWTSNLVGPSGVGFTLIGTGTPNSGSSTSQPSSSCQSGTHIIDNAGSSTFLMDFSPSQGATMRLSCLTIDPNSTSTALYAPIRVEGKCNSSGCPQFRVDNITFGLNTQWNESGNGAQSAAMIRVNDSFGVMDHNLAPAGSNVELFNAQMYSYLGVGSYGDNSWAQPDSLGGANNIFAENNTWNTQYLSLNDCEAGAIGGCRVVVRYNTITASQSGAFGIFENHGTETSGRGRSGREAEIYNNTMTCQMTCASVDGGIRGGTGMLFNNHANLTAGQGATTWMGLSLYRTVFNASPWGACGGSGSWDQNDGTVYFSGTVGSASNGGLTLTDTSQSWATNQLTPTGNPYSVYDATKGWWGEIASNTSNTITVRSTISEQSNYGFNAGDRYQVLRASQCIDQPGRGQGSYISGTTPSPTGYPNQALDPIYQWGDTYSGGAKVNMPMGSNSGKIIANRDYYPQASSIQTSPTSPFTGASGTGWGTLANRPTTCTPRVGYAAYTSDGSFVQLDVCTAANTWTSGVYTAYAYPHPLDSSSTATGPSPATNLKAVAQ